MMKLSDASDDKLLINNNISFADMSKLLKATTESEEFMSQVVRKFPMQVPQMAAPAPNMMMKMPNM